MVLACQRSSRSSRRAWSLYFETNESNVASFVRFHCFIHLSQALRISVVFGGIIFSAPLLLFHRFPDFRGILSTPMVQYRREQICLTQLITGISVNCKTNSCATNLHAKWNRPDWLSKSDGEGIPSDICLDDSSKHQGHNRFFLRCLMQELATSY